MARAMDAFGGAATFGDGNPQADAHLTAMLAVDRLPLRNDVADDEDVAEVLAAVVHTPCETYQRPTYMVGAHYLRWAAYPTSLFAIPWDTGDRHIGDALDRMMWGDGHQPGAAYCDRCLSTFGHHGDPHDRPFTVPVAESPNFVVFTFCLRCAQQLAIRRSDEYVFTI